LHFDGAFGLAVGEEFPIALLIDFEVVFRQDDSLTGALFAGFGSRAGGVLGIGAVDGRAIGCRRLLAGGEWFVARLGVFRSDVSVVIKFASCTCNSIRLVGLSRVFWGSC